MCAFISEEKELIEKYEEILGTRAELLDLMEKRKEQREEQRMQWEEESQAARQRNNRLLQDLQKIEDGLRGPHLPRPRLLALQTRYWASVEEATPAWEHFLLGKGPHPLDGPGPPPSRTKQKLSTAKDQGLPPRPKPRAAR